MAFDTALKREQAWPQATQTAALASVKQGDEQTMNPRLSTRLIVALSLAIVVALALFPPWHLAFRGRDIDCGYSFVAFAPEHCRIDATRLLVEWIAVAGIILICVMLLRARPPVASPRLPTLEAMAVEAEKRAAAADSGMAGHEWLAGVGATDGTVAVDVRPPGPLRPGSPPPFEELTEEEKRKAYDRALMLAAIDLREKGKKLHALRRIDAGEHLSQSEDPWGFGVMEQERRAGIRQYLETEMARIDGLARGNWA